MQVYYINLIIIPLLFYTLKRYGRDDLFLRIVFFQLLVLLALRSPSIGKDTMNYLEIFRWTKEYPFLDFTFSRHEEGYILLNKVLSFISNDQIFLALIMIIPLLLILKVIDVESDIKWLSVYLFISLGFYTNFFNIIRQVYAMSFIFLSFLYLKNDSRRIFFIYITIAFLFHRSSIIFLLLYLIKDLGITLKNYTYMLLLAVLIKVFSADIVNFLMNFSSIKYDISSRGGNNLLIFLVLTLFVAVLFRKQIIGENRKNIIYYNIMVLGILVQILAIEISIFSRMTSYFRIFSILLIPKIIVNIKNRNIRLIAYLIVILFAPVQYYVELTKDYSSIVPYLFFWQK